MSTKISDITDIEQDYPTFITGEENALKENLSQSI